MGQSHNYTSDEKNITQRAEKQRKNHAAGQYQHLHGGSFRLLRKQRKAALKKVRNCACQREQVLEQTGMTRGIAGAGPLADHLRNVSEFNAGKSDSVRTQFRVL